MAHQVSIWRAAQLVGVARGVLQQQVRTGALLLNDGMVSTEALLHLYPNTSLEESGLLERVAQIRDEAFGKRLRERLLPSQEVLAQRLFAQSQELGDVRLHLQRYHELVVALQKTIRERLMAQPYDAAWQALERQVTGGLAAALATDAVDLLEVMDDMLKIMTAQVTVQPSGHQFLVEGHSNLLQSGLHSGLRLNYGCGNGSCGMCKVRVIAGDVVQTQHYDYCLSETEKSQGYTLMCCHTAGSSELTLELLEAGGPQDIPEQQIVTKVRAITTVGPDTRLLQLQTPRTHRLRFLAGQSVSLGWSSSVQGDAQSTEAIASCPCDDRNLLFFVARDEANALAQAVFSDQLRHGDAVTVRGPMGEFVLSEGHRPLVFAACDLGYAPIKSLIEHALALDAVPSLSLFWLALRTDGHFHANQCRAWSEALDNFEYGLFTNTDVVAGAREIALAMHADLFDIECDFYLCGPAPFVDTLFDDLRHSGVPAAQIFRQVM
jgi:CDP-4-dehydro-6-deoxyglucose reductase